MLIRPPLGAFFLICLIYGAVLLRSPQNRKYTENCDISNPWSSKKLLNFDAILRSSDVMTGKSNITIIHMRRNPL